MFNTITSYLTSIVAYFGLSFFSSNSAIETRKIKLNHDIIEHLEGLVAADANADSQRDPETADIATSPLYPSDEEGSRASTRAADVRKKTSAKKPRKSEAIRHSEAIQHYADCMFAAKFADSIYAAEIERGDRVAEATQSNTEDAIREIFCKRCIKYFERFEFEKRCAIASELPLSDDIEITEERMAQIEQKFTEILFSSEVQSYDQLLLYLVHYPWLVNSKINSPEGYYGRKDRVFSGSPSLVFKPGSTEDLPVAKLKLKALKLAKRTSFRPIQHI